MIKKIFNKKQLYAVIITPSSMKKKGVNFFTDNHYNQQVGFMKHERNKVILPHIHKKVIRDIRTTTEVIYIMKGSLRIDFYDSKKKYLFSNTAKENYIVILIKGGHGFKVTKDIEMIEIKQGPYVEAKDKKKFKPTYEKKIKFKK
jgi:UDP-2,3-diacylglucosamine pyrophosphatase LpxH